MHDCSLATLGKSEVAKKFLQTPMAHTHSLLKGHEDLYHLARYAEKVAYRDGLSPQKDRIVLLAATASFLQLTVMYLFETINFTMYEF